MVLGGGEKKIDETDLKRRIDSVDLSDFQTQSKHLYISYLSYVKKPKIKRPSTSFRKKYTNNGNEKKL